MIEKRKVIILSHYVVDKFGRAELERAADNLGVEIIFPEPTPSVPKWRVKIASWLYDVGDRLMKE